MISICRKLSRGWNNFELMISICRKLSPSRDQQKKVPALAQLFQPPTNCNPDWSQLCPLQRILLTLSLTHQILAYHGIISSHPLGDSVVIDYTEDPRATQTAGVL